MQRFHFRLKEQYNGKHKRSAENEHKAKCFVNRKKHYKNADQLYQKINNVWNNRNYRANYNGNITCNSVEQFTCMYLGDPIVFFSYNVIE